MKYILPALAALALLAPATASAHHDPALKKWQKPLMADYMKAKKSGDKQALKRAVSSMVQTGKKRFGGELIGTVIEKDTVSGLPEAVASHHCGWQGLYCYEVYQIALLNANYKCANIQNWYGAPCINPGWIEWAGWIPGWVGVIMSTGQHWINQFPGWKRHCREAIYTIHGSNGSWANQPNPNGPESCWGVAG